MIYFLFCLFIYAVILTSVYLWEGELTVGDFLFLLVIAAVPLLNVIGALFAAGATFNYFVGTEGINRLLDKRVL